jgi:hypothetical protein
VKVLVVSGADQEDVVEIRNMEELGRRSAKERFMATVLSMLNDGAPL